MGRAHGMSDDGYMEDYNYHDWTKFIVRESKDKPKGPHFGAVLFETRSEYVPAYDDRDVGSTSYVPEIQYFAFPDKETLGAWLLRAKKDNKNFFFFEVKKLGSVAVKIAVDVDTDV